MTTKNLIRFLTLTACFAVSTSAFSQAKGDAEICSSIAEKMARLECYDNQNARQHPVKETASKPEVLPLPVIASKSVESPKEAAKPKKQLEPKVDKETSEKFTAKITAIRATASRLMIVELDNGQVWVETSHTVGEPPRAGDSVTIKPGMLGSHFLSGGFGMVLKVQRLR